MSLIGNKGEERQQILRQHLDIQKELERVRNENKSLKEINLQLQEQLEIREVDFQNLFSYIQEIQATGAN